MPQQLVELVQNREAGHMPRVAVVAFSIQIRPQSSLGLLTKDGVSLWSVGPWGEAITAQRGGHFLPPILLETVVLTGVPRPSENATP